MIIIGLDDAAFGNNICTANENLVFDSALF